VAEIARSQRYRDALPAGTILEGRYEILRVCGQGGMSTVYVARDLRFSQVERLCAVKEMFTREPDERTRMLQLANFEREAALLATLSHPAIPKIYDYFTVGGLVYLVLEFIEGTDLERMIANKKEPVPEDTLVDWTLQILDVLAYLHEQQPEPIVFRDLKPSNIMLRNDGAITLIDFGIARTFQPLQRGTMIGTEGYAPPEQYRGIAEPRGDIYALGATLHHLATGSDPRHEPPFTFAQRPPRELNPELSPEFEELILRAVAYTPADRFPSAAAMAQAVIEIRDRRARGAVTDTNPVIPATVAPTEQHAETSRPGTERTAAAERIVWTVQTGDEVRGTAAVAGSTAYIGSYDQHLYAVNPQDGGILWRFRANRGIVARPLVHGDLVVVGAEDHTVYALRAVSGRLIWSFRTAMPVRSSAAAYGDAIVVGSDDGYCYCLDLEQGNLLWRQRTWGPVRSSPLVVEDRVIVGSDDGSLYCYSATDGHLRWRTQLGRPVLSSPAAGGNIVVVGCTDGAIYGVDIDNGARRWAFQTSRPIIASPRIVGDLVVIGSTDGALYALERRDGSLLWSQQIANQITSSAAIDGARCYVGTVDGYVVCLQLDDGQMLWTQRLGGAIASTPAVTRGMVIIGCLDGRIYGLRA
jgi:outer membrane protein assembly factor BamB/tRNA A-37 threonylcarbamoyl transferase component Bud32